MYNALALAHYFVKQSFETKIPVTAHKVEFLVYFAHGWHMAVDGRPLIWEPVKAYRHGPVVEPVHKYYSKIKDLRGSLDLSLVSGIKERDKEFLDGIWLYYSNLNEMDMLNLCTGEETPWFTTYEKSSKELIIENSKIKQHYRLLHVSHPEFCDLDDPISVVR